MEEIIQVLTLNMAWLLEGAAAVIIALASVKALYKYFLIQVRRESKSVPVHQIRLGLGRSLSLALEFLLGADILKTAVAPSWNDIGQLAAIAVLRTGLNFFLERELKSSQEGKMKETAGVK